MELGIRYLELGLSPVNCDCSFFVNLDRELSVMEAQNIKTIRKESEDDCYADLFHFFWIAVSFTFLAVTITVLFRHPERSARVQFLKHDKYRLKISLLHIKTEMKNITVFNEVISAFLS